MVDIKAKVKKWGDSLAVIIPKEVVKAENIKPNETIQITINRIVDLSDLFGSWKPKTKKSTQELIDEEKKGWM